MQIDINDTSTWGWRLRFVDWLGRKLGVDRIVDTLPVPMLQSSDGQFRCTAEHAVECAYLLNLAEAVMDVGHPHMSNFEIGEVILHYLRCSTTIENAQNELRDALDEVSEETRG